VLKKSMIMVILPSKKQHASMATINSRAFFIAIPFLCFCKQKVYHQQRIRKAMVPFRAKRA
jgi:hypothetical protein